MPRQLEHRRRRRPARKALVALVLGWGFYSLGYFDQRGTFVLNVGHIAVVDQANCELARAEAVARGWQVLDRCIPIDDGSTSVFFPLDQRGDRRDTRGDR